MAMWDMLTSAVGKVGDWGTQLGSKVANNFMLPDTVNAAGEAVKGGYNWDRISSTLGQVGASIAPKDSWQQGLGMAAAGISQNKMTAKASEKALNYNKGLLEKIFGVFGAPTGADEPGLNDIKINSKGFSISGNPDTGGKFDTGNLNLNLGGSAPNAGFNAGAISPTLVSAGGGGPSPTPAGGSIDMDALIRRVGMGSGNFQGSPSGLTSADLEGLSPEVQHMLMQTQLAGGQQSLETMKLLSDIFGKKEGVWRTVDDYETGNSYLVNPVTGDKVYTGKIKSDGSWQDEVDANGNMRKVWKVNPNPYATTETSGGSPTGGVAPSAGGAPRASFPTGEVGKQKQAEIINNAIVNTPAAKDADRQKAAYISNTQLPNNATRVWYLKKSWTQLGGLNPFSDALDLKQGVLPDGLTMGWIRKNAASKGVDPQDVINSFAEEGLMK